MYILSLLNLPPTPSSQPTLYLVTEYQIKLSVLYNNFPLSQNFITFMANKYLIIDIPQKKNKI